MQLYQPAGVADPVLIDTLAGLTLNGLVFYGTGLVGQRPQFRSRTAPRACSFLIAPFSTLEPLAWLVETATVLAAFRLDLSRACGRRRSRPATIGSARASTTRGLVNSAVALYLIAARREWFDHAAWAVALVIAGLTVLSAGYLLDARERRNERR